MTYYIKRHDLPFDAEASTSKLGEVSFDRFWPEQGWEYLQWLSENGTEILLEKAIITDSAGGNHKVEKFINYISGLIIVS